MTATTQPTRLSQDVSQYLPFLRRYARALTGSQSSGDKYAVATLEAILRDDTALTAASSVRTGLFRIFHVMWKSSGAPVDQDESGLRARAQRHLARLTENTREALLLHAIENFEVSAIAEIMEVDKDEVEHLLRVASDEMQESARGRVLIIEDEAIIAFDLEGIVSEVGHTVLGIARTLSAAVEMGQKDRPDLILADIQLADNSSGIDAVNDLLKTTGDIPVIFITAFPERLLTGDRHEPAFLISKPYSAQQVRTAVSQAMFFASTETLKT